MKFFVLAFCFLPLCMFAQRDTCITTVDDFTYVQQSKCGTRDHKGRWHGPHKTTMRYGKSYEIYDTHLLKMRHGKRHGLDVRMHKISHVQDFWKMEETHYRCDKETGKYKFWDDQGHLMREGRHRNDYDVGTWKSYDSTGVLIWWKKYKNKHAYIEKRFYNEQLQSSRAVNTKKKIREEHYYDREGTEIDVDQFRKVWKN